MAVIIREVRHIGQYRSRRATASPIALGAVAVTMLVASVVLGAPVLGLLFAGTFGIGATLALAEHRPLNIGEAAALGTMHFAALVIFAV